MKIKILTFHCAKNYGAVLQAYALKQILLQVSCDVSIINYCPRSLTSSFYGAKGSIKLLFKTLIRTATMPLRCFVLGYGTKLRKYDLFLKNYLCIKGKKITNRKYIAEKDTDVVVLGSDQIWNANITGADTTYFGNFTKKLDCKIVSYAASIGNDVSSVADKEFLQKNINRIDMISVREETAKEVLSKLTANPIEVVLDPTLLLTSKDWTEIAVEPKESDYILLYTMENAEQTNKVAESLSSKTGLDIVEIFSSNRSLKQRYMHKTISTAGPCDFVGLFKNAKYVVTSSFHGVAFSLVFNKQFVALPNGAVSSRMTDLLKRVNLFSRFIVDANKLPDKDIDYGVVNSLIEKEREKSMSFLKKAFEGVEK